MRWDSRLAPVAALLAGLTAPAWGGAARAESFVLLAPARGPGGEALTRPDPRGRSVPIATRLEGGPLAEHARKILAGGFSAVLPDLDRQARAATAPTECGGLGRSVLILFSDEDGGYARKGFFVKGEDGATRFCGDHYIDLTVDEESLASGEFEEVLAHEFGHVLLRRLLGPIPATPSPIPATPSRNFHSALAITDPITAFDEGFGEHFQPVAARFTQTAGFRRRLEADAVPALADRWFSRQETWIRESWAPRGLLAFDKLERWDREGGAYERWMADETSSALDACRLKSGSQMMASEAVAASFFFDLINAREDAPGADRAAVAGAAENYRKLIVVLGRVGAWPKAAPLVALARAWGERFPEDRARVTAVFLAVTYGGATSAPVWRLNEAAACRAALGDRDVFLAARAEAKAAGDHLASEGLAGRVALDAALGPELWLADPAVGIPTAPWSKKRSEPLVLDLNTARGPALTLLFAKLPRPEALA
ncbi:MAG: hypothetical protein H0X27_12745, partial [Caulobacteraceae bacterium]|nr:hypothetical protein [Caulobacteraceae bacterium]